MVCKSDALYLFIKEMFIEFYSAFTNTMPYNNKRKKKTPPQNLKKNRQRKNIIIFFIATHFNEILMDYTHSERNYFPGLLFSKFS